MNNLQQQRFYKADELFYNHLIHEADIFNDAFELRKKCEYKSDAYNLLTEVVDMNIEIGQLHNKTTAHLRRVRELLTRRIIEDTEGKPPIELSENTVIIPIEK
jgi:hypothetical protein